MLKRLLVRRLCGEKTRGKLIAGPLVLPCALGRAGICRGKREGDGATPAGRFRLLQGFHRGAHRPASGLALRRIGPDDGWCDAPADPRYNRLVARPCAASHERMLREDGLYDLVIDIAYNRGPILKGRGSAIFMHVARPGFSPTEGCVALRKADLRRLLRRLGPRTVIDIR